MYFVPLSQMESVQLLIHALRMAGGEADCSECPASRVCMKQCLTIADSVEKMLQDGTLPCSFLDQDAEEDQGEKQKLVKVDAGKAPKKPGLKVVK